MLSRKITLIIHFIFDELLPPLIRDSKIFSFTFGTILFGKRTRDFIRFKNDVAKLNSKSFEKTYKDLNPYFIKRGTDLNQKCIEQLKKDVIGKKILDAGCGNGYLTKVLQNENNKVIGFDIYPPLTSLGAKFSFVKGNLEKLPFKDKEFDTVVCAHTLEHVINLQNVVNELRRVTSERLLIVTPLQRPYNFTFDLHLHFFPYPYSFINAVGAPKGYYYVKNCGGDLYYYEQK